MKAAQPEQWQIYSIYLLSRRRQQYLQKGNPEHVFLSLRFLRGSGEYSKNLPFWRARFIDPLYLQNYLKDFFNQKRREWTKCFGDCIFKIKWQNSCQYMWETLVFVVMNNPANFQVFLGQQSPEMRWVHDLELEAAKILSANTDKWGKGIFFLLITKSLYTTFC